MRQFWLRAVVFVLAASCAASVGGVDFRISDADVNAIYPEIEKSYMDLHQRLGEGNVVVTPPISASEDFSQFGRDGVPTFMIWVGAAEPGAYAAARESGVHLPSPHSPLFAPDRERTLKTAILTEATAALSMLGAGK